MLPHEEGLITNGVLSRYPSTLKFLIFFDRHYNYKQLVRIIIRDTKSNEEKVMKIFEWTHKNIRKVPEGLPIIDDHVWYSIVRGYGANDQSSDVFTTLCNYAGLNAFYLWVYPKEQKPRIPLSFVKIKEKWVVFDPYRGVYFKNKEGDLADLLSLSVNNHWVARTLGGTQTMDYGSYFKNLPSIKNLGLRRADIQLPINRLLFEIKNRIDKFLKWIRK